MCPPFPISATITTLPHSFKTGYAYARVRKPYSGYPLKFIWYSVNDRITEKALRMVTTDPDLMITR